MSHSKHNLNKMLIGEGKTYKEVKIIQCSAKIIPNALKWQKKTTIRRLVGMAKISMSTTVCQMTSRY